MNATPIESSPSFTLRGGLSFVTVAECLAQRQIRPHSPLQDGIIYREAAPQVALGLRDVFDEYLTSEIKRCREPNVKDYWARYGVDTLQRSEAVAIVQTKYREHLADIAAARGGTVDRSKVAALQDLLCEFHLTLKVMTADEFVRFRDNGLTIYNELCNAINTIASGDFNSTAPVSGVEAEHSHALAYVSSMSNDGRLNLFAGYCANCGDRYHSPCPWALEPSGIADVEAVKSAWAALRDLIENSEIAGAFEADEINNAIASLGQPQGSDSPAVKPSLGRVKLLHQLRDASEHFCFHCGLLQRHWHAIRKCPRIPESAISGGRDGE